MLMDLIKKNLSTIFKMKGITDGVLRKDETYFYGYIRISDFEDYIHEDIILERALTEVGIEDGNLYVKIDTEERKELEDIYDCSEMSVDNLFIVSYAVEDALNRLLPTPKED